jgi:hypothetical protein
MLVYPACISFNYVSTYLIGDNVLYIMLNNAMKKLMNLIIKGTKTKLHSPMECYSLCDLIMINANGPFVQYLLTFRSVDNGNHEAKTRASTVLVGSKCSQLIRDCTIESNKT